MATWTADRHGIVTVVSGLPRSGTSMIMQMLAAGGMPLLTDGLRGPDDDNPRGYLEYEPVKRSAADTTWVGAAAGKAVKVVHLLVPSLPPAYQYRVIFVTRDIGEVLASQRRMLDRARRRRADLPPQRLAEVFEGQVRRVLDWAAAQPHVTLLAVEYADVIADAAAGARRINEFVGGTLDESAMAAAVDPSLYRQRRDA